MTDVKQSDTAAPANADAAAARVANQNAASNRPAPELKPTLVFGPTAVAAALLVAVQRQRRGETPPKDVPDRPNDIVLSITTKAGVRLLAQVTYQHADKTCPACGSSAIAPLGNVPKAIAKEFRCAQCSKQFPASDQPEDQVYVIGVTDDANDVNQKAPLTSAEQAAKDAAHKEYETKAAEAEKASEDVPKEQEFVRARVSNTWKRVATVEVEPGVCTELWASLESKPVNKVVVAMNHPDSFKRPTSVAVMVSQLEKVVPEDPTPAKAPAKAA